MDSRHDLRLMIREILQEGYFINLLKGILSTGGSGGGGMGSGDSMWHEGEGAEGGFHDIDYGEYDDDDGDGDGGE